CAHGSSYPYYAMDYW
nr:immunoglobulin heavy chain junction region [Mus musculus]